MSRSRQARGHRPRVELVPARRVHLRRAGGHAWWRRTDEIHEAVRVGEGLDAAGELQPEPMERALETLELYAHFCRATGDRGRPAGGDVGDPRRDATRSDFLRAGARALGPRGRGALARGGGALRLPRGGQLDDARRRRRARPRRRLDAAHAACEGRARRRHALVAARRRAHDRALPARRARQGQAAQGAARARGASSSAEARRGSRAAGGWSASAARSATWPSAAELAAELPSYGVQGFAHHARARSTSSSSGSRSCPPSERGDVPGIKAERGDLILAGAVVVQMRDGGGRLRGARGHRGRPARGRLLRDAARGRATRRCSRTCGARRCSTSPPPTDADFAHVEHVARLALDAVGRARPRPACTRRPARARAAVGGGDAARHRHGGRLRRPPQALALPDPQRRPAGLLAARDRR